MFEVDTLQQLPEDQGLFRPNVTNAAKNRRVYSEARKSLAVLPSTDSLCPSETEETSDASRRWRKASIAILKGIRSTNTVQSTAGLLKYFSVTKELNKEQLLHEKFCHLLAIDGLEEKIAIRYKEATALARKFREIKSSLNSKEQLQAMDAAQSILNRLEAVRRLFGGINLDSDEAEEMFYGIDESLDELRDLCEVKTLKSKFRQAGKHFILARRLSKAGQERTRKRLLREAFQRSVRKVTNVQALLRPSAPDTEAETDRAASPVSGFFDKLQASQEDFHKRSAEWKQSLAEEVLALGQQMPTSHRSGHFVKAPPPTPGNESSTASPSKDSGTPTPFVFSAAVDRRRNSLSERKRRDSVRKGLSQMEDEQQVAITSFDFMSQGQKLDRVVLADKRKKVQAKMQYLQWLKDAPSGNAPAPSPMPGLGMTRPSGGMMEQMVAMRMAESGSRQPVSREGRHPPAMARRFEIPLFQNDLISSASPQRSPLHTPYAVAPTYGSPLPPPAAQGFGPSSPVTPRSPATPRLAGQLYRKDTSEFRRTLHPITPGAPLSQSKGSFQAKVPWSAFVASENPASKAQPAAQTDAFISDGFEEAEGEAGGCAGGGLAMPVEAMELPAEPSYSDSGVCGGGSLDASTAMKKSQRNLGRAEHAYHSPSLGITTSPQRPSSIRNPGGDSHAQQPRHTIGITTSPPEQPSIHRPQGNSSMHPSQNRSASTGRNATAEKLQQPLAQPTPPFSHPTQNPTIPTHPSAASFTAAAGEATACSSAVHRFSAQKVPPQMGPDPYSTPLQGSDNGLGEGSTRPTPTSLEPSIDVLPAVSVPDAYARKEPVTVSNGFDASMKLAKRSAPKAQAEDMPTLSRRGMTVGGPSRQPTTPTSTPTAASKHGKAFSQEPWSRDLEPAEQTASTLGRHEEKHTRMVMAELEILATKEERSHQAAFAASAFLATMGLDLPLDPGDTVKPLPAKVQTYSGLQEAKEQVAEFVSQTETEIEDLEDPQEALEKLIKLDRALGFLDQIRVLESCLESSPPVEVQPPDRGSEYDWKEHVGSLKRVRSTLSSSEKWRQLDSDASNQSLQEMSQDSTYMTVCPERLEWIQESHPSLRACRSQHAEFAPQRNTLEKTVRERHQRGVRSACVRPELSHMWQEYCRLVWKEDSVPKLSFNASQSALLLPSLC